MEKLFMGIDVGTQGVRAALVSESGSVVAEASRPFALTQESRQEQSPAEWGAKTLDVLDELILSLTPGVDRDAIAAIGIDSTSGTVIPLGEGNQPVHAALMYSDPRSAAAGRECTDIAKRFVRSGYTGFGASSGLAKMVWFVQTYPAKAAAIRKWVHAADYLVGQLSGSYDVTDYTNALKSGYDLSAGQWPSYLTTHLPLRRDWFQRVVPSGTPIGYLRDELAARWGLYQTQVVVGMTDGCASQVASGAVNPGDWNTTIGTTLVIKGVTTTAINDPEGRLYSHRHPDGFWMPGGASNTGADWVSTDFGRDGAVLDRLNEEAAARVPTGRMAWPLKQTGERFPFIAPQAQGFIPEGLTPAERFAASMEGVAYIERLAYDLVEALSGERPTAVYTAGGGSNSDIWLEIRSSVLNLPIYKCRETSGAVGAAITAASKTHYTSLAEAAAQMTKVEREVAPRQAWVDGYEVNYRQFVEELKKRKYI